jgi:phosphoribosyl 1,2-cyclic phosphodiesterase
VRLTILGSGSGGNCAFLETNQTRILIDAGFSGRQIRERLAQIARTPESLQAILITHEHTDHIQGLATLSAKLKVPVYCNRFTLEAIQRQIEVPFPCHIFSTGSAFEVGDVLVETFPIPHDAQDPVGFLLRAGGANLGFLTDLGHATKLVVERVRCANVLVLETNHDVKLLQDDPHRPWSVKQRILSRHGHLSNEAAAEVAQNIVSSDLSHVYLGHLSKECNRPELALAAVRGRLEKIGAKHVNVICTSQKVPCATLPFGHDATPPALVERDRPT